jgi:hypothetical protein
MISGKSTLKTAGSENEWRDRPDLLRKAQTSLIKNFAAAQNNLGDPSVSKPEILAHTVGRKSGVDYSDGRNINRCSSA